jgi:hypothetical protein
MIIALLPMKDVNITDTEFLYAIYAAFGSLYLIL